MQGPQVNEGLATKIANKVRSAYSGFAHSSAYIPDKWALAWGKFAKDLAKEVVDYVASEKGDASAGKIIKTVNSKAVAPKQEEQKVESTATVENVVVEDVAVDYDYYIGKCRELIKRLNEKRNGYIAALDKSGFKDIEFESKPELEALYKILTDSFVPEKKAEETKDAPAAKQDATAKESPASDASGKNGEASKTESPAQEEPSQNQETAAQPEQKNKQTAKKPNKKQSFANEWEMIGSFKANYDKKGEVTTRVVQLMFDAATKGDGDPASVARTALQGVGASNAARSVK